MMAAMRPTSSADARGGGRSAFGCAASALLGATPRSGYTPRTSSEVAHSGKVFGAGPAGDSFGIDSSPGTSSRQTKTLGGTPRTKDRSPVKKPQIDFGLVRAMKGTGPPEIETTGASPRAPSPSHSEGEDSDCGKSVCSNVSTLSTMSSSGQTKRDGRNGSGSSAGSANRSIHMSFSDCCIDVEQQHSGERSQMSLLHDFRQLCGEGSQADGLMECLRMSSWLKPNKLQQHAIPALLHFMGKQLGGQTGTTGKGKTSIVIQGPAKAGKTSAVILSLLAAIDVSLHQPQAILIYSSSKRDFDKYLNIFTLMQTVTYQSFHDEDDEDPEAPLDEKSAEVRAARTAQILIGQPRKLLKLLSSSSRLCLDSVKMLVVDDAEELLYEGASSAPSSPTAKLVREFPGLSGAATERTGSKVELGNTEQTRTLASQAQMTSPQLEYIVQICNVLDCRQYSQNMSDTYRIRSGDVQGMGLRYVILAQQGDASSRKVLRLLKKSLMQKTNLLSMESCPPPSKLIRAMKHYNASAKRSEWVRIFAGLVQSLMFPRALIFCDTDEISDFYKQMVDMKIAVSANLPEAKGSNGEPMGAAEARRRAVQDFTSNKSQFLLTRSEPAVCQIMLPKVSCVFHFGIPSDLPSVYGVRLLPLDQEMVKDASSILFVEPKKGSSVSSSIGKLFSINFLDMPFEFLPSHPVVGGGGAGTRASRTSRV